MGDAAEREQTGRPPVASPAPRVALLKHSPPVAWPAVVPEPTPGPGGEGGALSPGESSLGYALSANVTVRKPPAASAASVHRAATPMEPLALDHAAAAAASPAPTAVGAGVFSKPPTALAAAAMETEAGPVRPGGPQRNNSTIFTTANKSRHLAREWREAMELAPVRAPREHATQGAHDPAWGRRPF